MATDTKKEEQEYEARPWDQEDENNFNTIQSQTPAWEEHDTDDFTNNDTQGEDLVSRAEEDKENVKQTPSAVGEAPKESKPADEAGGSSAGSRMTRPAATDQQNSTTTTRQRSRPLPSVREGNEADKGRLVKRNRRRNRKSGYDTSTTEEMPLTERRQPPQQQIQPQEPPKKKDDPMRLRLDLNLDIEVELKARIHGDLTLSLFS